jgi:hypothetical protein
MEIRRKPRADDADTESIHETVLARIKSERHGASAPGPARRARGLSGTAR